MRLSSFTPLLVFGLSQAGVWAIPARRSAPAVKESVAPPPGWVKQAPAPADHVIELRIGLPQPNFDILEQHLYEVSDPEHARYGQHLSKEQVEELVAPHPASIEVVHDWLSSHGIPEGNRVFSAAKDWVTVKVPVAIAEAMLDTTYHIWKHVASGDSIVRTTSYSLPQHLHDHVEVVQPTTMFGRFKGFRSTLHTGLNAVDKVVENLAPISDSASGVTVDASCNTTITITCLQQLYNAVGFKPSAAGRNQIGITGYLGEIANDNDLQSFYANQRPDALGSSFKFVSVNGSFNNQSAADAGVEANLDVQFAFGLSFPTPGTFWSTAGSPPFIPDINTPSDTNEPYTTWLDFIIRQPFIPQTISTSYGDDEQTVPESFARRVCNDFAQLGARGVSLMFSSGDGGVGDGDEDPATQTCFTNDGRNLTRFIPGFPASCPFVTAVGGTTNIPEHGIFFSGGGFSNFFPRPSYQDAAVTKFLNGLPKGTYQGLFNPAGRGIPDVSAQSNNFLIFVGNRSGHVGGTSASSPTFAGFVSLLNDARIAKNQPPLGFLNPLIYSTRVSSGFNDILTGNNPGCGTPGFNATKGWDAITGLGTPDFGKLKSLVT